MAAQNSDTNYTKWYEDTNYTNQHEWGFETPLDGSAVEPLEWEAFSLSS